jgi:hypothetical protein
VPVPVPEPQPQPEPQPEPEPESQPEPMPRPEPEPMLVPAHMPESESEPKPEPKPEPEPEPLADPVAQPPPEAETEPVAEAMPEPAPEVVTEPLAEPAREPATDPDAAAPASPRAAGARAAPPRARLTAPIAVLAVAVGVAAAAIGFVVAPSSGTKSRPSTALVQRASAGPFTISYPAGWQRSETAPTATRLTLANALTLTPGASAPGGALVLGTATTANSTLLPSGFTAALATAPQGATVKLGSQTFKRYLDLLPQGASTPESVYALPTTRGTAIAACVVPRSNQTAFAATCERAVASLTTAGPVLPLTVNTAYASALGSVISKLNAVRAADGPKLTGAKNQRGQASAAAGLAQAYTRAAAAAAGLSPGPIGGAANAAIVGALRGLEAGYQSLSSAAQHNDKHAYAAAQAAIGNAESALSAAFGQLQQDGYTVG